MWNCLDWDSENRLDTGVILGDEPDEDSNDRACDDCKHRLCTCSEIEVSDSIVTGDPEESGADEGRVPKSRSRVATLEEPHAEDTDETRCIASQSEEDWQNDVIDIHP